MGQRRWMLAVPVALLAAGALSPVPTLAWLDLVLGPLGVLVLLLIIGWTGARSVWVWGWQYREMVARYESMLTEARENNKRVIDLGFRLMEKAQVEGSER